MAISISNTAFLASTGQQNSDNPLVFYKSILLPEDITADEYEIDRPPVNLWNPDTSSVWQGTSAVGSPSAITEQFIYLANPNEIDVDYIAIVKHNLGENIFTVTLQHFIGLTWTDIDSPVVITNDSPIVGFFDQLNSPSFRIKITKSLAGSPAFIAAPIIAHVKMGQATILQRRNYVGAKPPINSIKKTIQNGSDSGQYLGMVVVRSYQVGDLNQENNTPDFVRSTVAPFIDHCNGTPAIDGTAPSTFVYCWRPSAYPNELVYAWADEIRYPENQGSDSMGGRMKWGMSLGAIA